MRKVSSAQERLQNRSPIELLRARMWLHPDHKEGDVSSGQALLHYLWERCLPLWWLVSPCDKFSMLSLLCAEIKRRDKLKYQNKMSVLNECNQANETGTLLLSNLCYSASLWRDFGVIYSCYASLLRTPTNSTGCIVEWLTSAHCISGLGFGCLGFFSSRFRTFNLHSTIDTGIVLQRTVVKARGCEHTLCLWFLCVCVFSWRL